MRGRLIITGTHRGTIWSDRRADDADLAPLLDRTGKPVTFTRWCVDWLDKGEPAPRRVSKAWPAWFAASRKPSRIVTSRWSGRCTGTMRRTLAER